MTNLDNIPEEDREFVTDREQACYELLELLQKMGELVAEGPADHTKPLDNTIHGVACAILDATRIYRTAPDHYYGPVADAAKLSQLDLEKNRRTQTFGRGTPPEKPVKHHLIRHLIPNLTIS